MFILGRVLFFYNWPPKSQFFPGGRLYFQKSPFFLTNKLFVKKKKLKNFFFFSHGGEDFLFKKSKIKFFP